MVRRTSRTRDGLASWPVAAWKRRLNCSFFSCESCSLSWSSLWARRSAVFISLPLFGRRHRLAEADDDFGLDRQLRRTALERDGRDIERHALELEHDAARLHARHPIFRRALARAHADFGRLRRHRDVGEDADVQTALALDVAGDRAARRLDL